MITSNFKNDLASINSTLRSVSLSLTKNSSDAEDLYQDTTLNIYTKMHQFQPNTNFKAWAVTIMKNLFFNDFRESDKNKCTNSSKD